jgi:hypothetical protein
MLIFWLGCSLKSVKKGEIDRPKVAEKKIGQRKIANGSVKNRAEKKLYPTK